LGRLGHLKFFCLMLNKARVDLQIAHHSRSISCANPDLAPPFLPKFFDRQTWQRFLRMLWLIGMHAAVFPGRLP
jgi:hypothetical protein